jgi:Domain of unknown function (DUF4188)
MPEIFPGRWSGDIEGDFVVFLIGMRVNRPWKLRKVAFMLGTMPKLLKELDADASLGCLGSWQVMRSPIAPTVIQYWRSFEELEAYAAALTHKDVWKRFYELVKADGDVGIWHETFKVRAGEYEAVYGNMPVFGLAAAARPLPAAQKANTAAARIGASATDKPAVEPY